MQESETREFPLADILSVTTPRLLSIHRTQGVCDLVEWMLGIEPIPRMINLQEWSRLKTATGIARTSLLRQHPQLRDVQPPDGIDQADLLVWLFDAERTYGEHLAVERATQEVEHVRKAVIDFGRTVATHLETMWTALQPTVRALARLGEELRGLAAQDSEGVNIDDARNSSTIHES